MNTKIIVGIVIVAVVGLGGWYFVSKKSTDSTPTNTSTNTTNTENTNTAAAAEEFKVDGKEVSREEFGQIGRAHV